MFRDVRQVGSVELGMTNHHDGPTLLEGVDVGVCDVERKKQLLLTGRRGEENGVE